MRSQLEIVSEPIFLWFRWATGEAQNHCGLRRGDKAIAIVSWIASGDKQPQFAHFHSSFENSEWQKDTQTIPQINNS